jgi:hypothetical protein
MTVQNNDRNQSVDQHVYRVDYRTRGVLRVLIIFMAGLIFMPTLRPTSTLYGLLMPRIVMALLAIWLWERAGRRVTLSETGIELAGWFSKRALRQDAIRGYQIETLGRAGGGSYYVIIPKKGRRMTLPLHLEMDEYWHSWMHQFPKLKT